MGVTGKEKGREIKEKRDNAERESAKEGEEEREKERQGEGKMSKKKDKERTEGGGRAPRPEKPPFPSPRSPSLLIYRLIIIYLFSLSFPRRAISGEAGL